MGGRTIDGRAHAARVEAAVRSEVEALRRAGAPPPQLDVVLVGDDPASAIYVRRKREACERVGVAVKEHRLASTTSEGELRRTLDALNRDPMVTGVLLQLPLPSGLDERRLLEAVDPHKDVDCFHPENVGRAVQGTGTLLPATPRGVMLLLEGEGVPLRGAHAVVVNHSNLIGRPLSALLLQKDATVTVAHKHTRDLASVTRQADVLVSGTGVPGLITRAHVKPGAVVVDVGIARVQEKVVGDVRFAEVVEVASAVTPVPGGVGPMTVAVLLANVLAAHRIQRGAEVART